MTSLAVLTFHFTGWFGLKGASKITWFQNPLFQRRQLHPGYFSSSSSYKVCSVQSLHLPWNNLLVSTSPSKIYTSIVLETMQIKFWYINIFHFWLLLDCFGYQKFTREKMKYSMFDKSKENLDSNGRLF